MKNDISAYEKVKIARDIKRPKAETYIKSLISDFLELHGDYISQDDHSIIGGIGFFEKTAVTVIAQSKGVSIEENIKRNFGMTSPSGFRKAKRLAKQAEKFNRPIITFIDTSGAYPGKDAEINGQSRAIAESIELFAKIKVPVIAVLIGEGGSGGALAISVADKIISLSNSVYSILSPEGFASILWKDEKRAAEAASLMELDAKSLKKYGFIDEIISEGDSINNNFLKIISTLKKEISSSLKKLLKYSNEELLEKRYEKYRKF